MHLTMNGHVQLNTGNQIYRAFRALVKFQAKMNSVQFDYLLSQIVLESLQSDINAPLLQLQHIKIGDQFNDIMLLNRLYARILPELATSIPDHINLVKDIKQVSLYEKLKLILKTLVLFKEHLLTLFNERKKQITISQEQKQTSIKFLRHSIKEIQPQNPAQFHNDMRLKLEPKDEEYRTFPKANFRSQNLAIHSAPAINEIEKRKTAMNAIDSGQLPIIEQISMKKTPEYLHPKADKKENISTLNSLKQPENRIINSFITLQSKKKLSKHQKRLSKLKLTKKPAEQASLNNLNPYKQKLIKSPEKKIKKVTSLKTVKIHSYEMEQKQSPIHRNKSHANLSLRKKKKRILV